MAQENVAGEFVGHGVEDVFLAVVGSVGETEIAGRPRGVLHECVIAEEPGGSYSFAMKLTLDTVSAPATGRRADQILRAVKQGKSVVNSKGKAFIKSLLADLRPRASKSARSKSR